MRKLPSEYSRGNVGPVEQVYHPLRALPSEVKRSSPDLVPAPLEGQEEVQHRLVANLARSLSVFVPVGGHTDDGVILVHGEVGCHSVRPSAGPLDEHRLPTHEGLEEVTDGVGGGPISGTTDEDSVHERG